MDYSYGLLPFIFSFNENKDLFYEPAECTSKPIDFLKTWLQWTQRKV